MARAKLERRFVMGGIVDVEYTAEAAVLFAQLLASLWPELNVNPAMKAWFKRYEKEADRPWEQICFYLVNRMKVQTSNEIGHMLTNWLEGRPMKTPDLALDARQQEFHDSIKQQKKGKK